MKVPLKFISQLSPTDYHEKLMACLLMKKLPFAKILRCRLIKRGNPFFHTKSYHQRITIRHTNNCMQSSREGIDDNKCLYAKHGLEHIFSYGKKQLSSIPMLTLVL